MKKTYALMIMCLLVFSIVPLAFAEEDTDSTNLDNTESANVETTNTETEKTDNSDSVKRELTQKARKVVGEAAKTKENVFREIKKLATAEQAERIKTLAKEEFREFQESRLMQAVKKCKEQGLEGCEVKAQKRLKLVANLQQKDLERIQNIVEHKSEALRKVQELEQDENFEKYKKEREFKARALTKEKLTNARDKLEKAKERYEVAKNNYQKAMDKFEERKKEIACEDDNCPEIKADAKKVLQHASERVLETLNQLLERVDSAEYLTEDEVANSKAFLEKEIAKVNAIMLKVENFDETTPKADINTAFKELRKVTQEANQAVKRAAGKLVNSRIGGIVISSQHLKVKLNRIIERMAEASKDTGATEPLIVEFNSFLENAQANFELAKTEYDARNVETAHEYITKAKEALKEAQSVLQQIVKSIADNDGTEELEDSDLDEIEDQIDNENEDSTEVGDAQ
ncbi:hypothetical protein J4418_03140 [Candidatus Woesearchaeota archaeon]|nr:hypothetical protein [Candidatus Woesearchaeota archaeon]